MKMILQVGGKERTFSEEELIAILEKHFLEEENKDEWFTVNPETIHRAFFDRKRQDSNQEKTRLIILSALQEVYKNEEKYGKPFEIMRSKNVFESISVKELEKIANSEEGCRLADDVEVALEWAQRIINGESWENLCNSSDNKNWGSLVKWKGEYKIVGGARNNCCCIPATSVSYVSFKQGDIIVHGVPLIARRK